MGRRKKSSNYVPPGFATSDTHKGYVAIYRDMIDSPAYIALEAPAKEVYTILRSQYKGPAMGNTVICPYGTFEHYGVRRQTLSRAIDLLETLGFIEVARGGLEHKPSKYTFVERWKKIKTKEDVAEAVDLFKDKLERKRVALERKKEWKKTHTG